VADQDQLLPEPRSFIRENLIWILGIIPFALAGIRVIVVSNGDVEVLRFLMKDLDVIVLMLATILPLLPLASFWLLIAWVDWVRTTPREKRLLFARWADLIIPGALFLVAMFIQTAFLIFSIIMLVLILGVRKFISCHSKRHPRYAEVNDPFREDMILFCALAVAPLLINSTAIWLPIEQVKIAEDELTGSVLSNDGDWTTFLDRDTQIHMFKSSEIEARTACSYANWATKPILKLTPSDSSSPTLVCPPREN
jgi:hypothetical protein